ncbi:MAG: restriction endonuclease subunit S [Nitrospira sp.]|nr:restriction endonuclease subunit S [Nitrospira sp.]
MKNGWQTKTLDQISTNLDSRRVPITKGVRAVGEYPYYGASGIVDYVAEYIFDENALLISEDGANLLARSTPIAFPASGKYWVSNHAHILKFESLTTQRFVELYLESIPLDDYVIGAAQPKLTQKALNSIPIPFPPLPEQQRIVGILDEAFDGLATATVNAEQNLRNARALFESHLQSVFTQRGKGWVEKRIGDVFDVGSSKRVFEKEWTPSGVPFYGGREVVQLAQSGAVVSDAYISEERYRDIAAVYGVPQEGDILMTARGTIGVGYVVKKSDKFYYKDGNLICLHPKTPTEPYFVLYAFRSKLIKDQLATLTGATVTHLPIEKTNSLILPFPDFHTQKRVVGDLRKLESETQRLEAIYQQKLAALGELKKSLLHQAFSGQL